MFTKFFYTSFVFYIIIVCIGTIYFFQTSNQSKKLPNYIGESTQDSRSENLVIDDIAKDLVAKEVNINLKEGEFELYKSYGNLFCIITTVEFKFPSLVSTLYTTESFRACSKEDFKSLSIPSITAQMQTTNTAFFYSLSQPHLNTMSIDLSQSVDPFISIGKLRFSKVALAKIPITSLVRNPQITAIDGSLFQPGKLPYTAFETQHDFYAYWKQGSLVFGLISPNGKYYVMTSFAYSALKDLGITNLEELKKYLSPKPGWQFVSYKLSKPLIIRYQITQGFASRRVIDEFGNYYIEIQSSNYFH